MDPLERADEERDAGEAEHEPDEPLAAYALGVDEEESEQRGEERSRRLEDRRRARVDPRLRPEQEVDGKRRVNEPTTTSGTKNVRSAAAVSRTGAEGARRRGARASRSRHGRGAPSTARCPAPRS